VGKQLTKKQSEDWTNTWMEVVDDINTAITDLPEDALQHYEPMLKRIDAQLEEFRYVLDDLRKDYATDI